MHTFKTELSVDLRELEYFSKSLMAFFYDQNIENGYQIDLALGEIIANIISHGEMDLNEKIFLQFRQSQAHNNYVHQIIDIRYKGKSFNPLRGLRDLRQLPEDVGLNLINTYLTPLSYLYKNQENFCQFSSKIEYSQSPQVMQQ